MILEVTSKVANDFVENWVNDEQSLPCVLLLAYDEDKDNWIAIDNETKGCYVENFDSKFDAIGWLNGDFQMGDYLENPPMVEIKISKRELQHKTFQTVDESGNLDIKEVMTSLKDNAQAIYDFLDMYLEDYDCDELSNDNLYQLGDLINMFGAFIEKVK